MRGGQLTCASSSTASCSGAASSRKSRSGARFLAKAPELYRRAPILHLNLTEVRAVAAELFASPHLARIESLSLAGNGLGDAEVALLAGSRHLGNLTWLD